MSIAERITSAMDANGVSAERLAMRLNVPVSEVQRLLGGEHALSDGEIADIACAIGTTASYLRGETDSIRPRFRIVAEGAERMSEEEKERIVRILLEEDQEEGK